jgi:hypothetical protein
MTETKMKVNEGQNNICLLVHFVFICRLIFAFFLLMKGKKFQSKVDALDHCLAPRQVHLDCCLCILSLITFAILKIFASFCSSLASFSPLPHLECLNTLSQKFDSIHNSLLKHTHHYPKAEQKPPSDSYRSSSFYGNVLKV